jgi:hypothetical protein
VRVAGYGFIAVVAGITVGLIGLIVVVNSLLGSTGSGIRRKDF